MDSVAFFDKFYIPAVYVPFMIFFARIIDVSMGTMRIIMVGRGQRFMSSLLGFLEVFIWLLAISQVLQNLHGIMSYISYSAGFAAGTYIGMTIERHIAFGTAMVRIIVPAHNNGIADMLVERGYRITNVAAVGARGPVEVVFSVVRRKELQNILEVVRKYKPEAFFTVEDVRMVKDFDADLYNDMKYRRWLVPFYWFRKSK